MEGINQKSLCLIIANFYRMKHSHGEAFLPKWYTQKQGYNVIKYAEATESLNHKKGVWTPQNLPKHQEDIIKEKNKKQKLPPLQLQGSMIHSTQLMYMNEFFCLFILVCLLD